MSQPKGKHCRFYKFLYGKHKKMYYKTKVKWRFYKSNVVKLHYMNFKISNIKSQNKLNRKDKRKIIFKKFKLK